MENQEKNESFDSEFSFISDEEPSYGKKKEEGKTGELEIENDGLKKKIAEKNEYISKLEHDVSELKSNYEKEKVEKENICVRLNELSEVNSKLKENLGEKDIENINLRKRYGVALKNSKDLGKERERSENLLMVNREIRVTLENKEKENDELKERCDFFDKKMTDLENNNKLLKEENRNISLDMKKILDNKAEKKLIQELEEKVKELSDLLDVKTKRLFNEEEYNSRILKELKDFSEKPNEILFFLRLKLENVTPRTPISSPFKKKIISDFNNSRDSMIEDIIVSDTKKFGRINLETSPFSPYYEWTSGLMCYIPFKIRIRTTKPVGSWKNISEISLSNPEKKDKKEVRVFLRPRFVNRGVIIRVVEAFVNFSTGNCVIRTKSDVDGEEIVFSYRTYKDSWCEIGVGDVDIDDINLSVMLKIQVTSEVVRKV